jgi:hypothetical protein
MTKPIMLFKKENKKTGDKNDHWKTLWIIVMTGLRENL